jgi:hypothetical protein
MQAPRFTTALLLVFLCLGADVGAAVFGRSFSIPEYSSELDRISDMANQIENNPRAADTAIDELRGDWRVESNAQVFEVNTAWMVDQFEQLKRNPVSEVRERLLERIHAMKADVESFQQVPPDSSGSRVALDKILARSEFHQVHGPTWLDRLKLKIAMWIFRLLSRFFGSSAVPVVGRVFVWSLVAIAVLVLAFFIYRTMKQNARVETIMPDVLPVSAKQWRIWLEEAEAAAAKGLWRDAVHLAYWGGISFLEENGMWRPDQARTPREYLRLLPAESQHRATLATLTRQLEVTWYGNKPAGPETFAQALTHLENLGCRQV